MSTSPLELTPREKRVFEKYREISTTATTAATRMKLVTDADKSRLVPDHGDEFIGKLLLADALGAADLDFSDGLISQLANAGAQGQALHVAGGQRQKTLPHVRRRSRVGRADRKPERVKEWAVHPRGEERGALRDLIRSARQLALKIE